jgi:hypothetical protein
MAKDETCVANECAMDYEDFDTDIFTCTDMQGQCGYMNFNTARTESSIMKGCIPCYTREEQSTCDRVVGCKWDKAGEHCHKDFSRCKWNYHNGKEVNDIECTNNPRCFWNSKTSECDSCYDIQDKGTCDDTYKCVWQGKKCIKDPCLVHSDVKAECYKDMANDCTWNRADMSCVSCNGFSERTCFDVKHCKWYPLESCLDSEFIGQCKRHKLNSKPCDDHEGSQLAHPDSDPSSQGDSYYDHPAGGHANKPHAGGHTDDHHSTGSDSLHTDGESHDKETGDLIKALVSDAIASSVDHIEPENGERKTTSKHHGGSANKEKGNHGANKEKGNHGKGSRRNDRHHHEESHGNDGDYYGENHGEDGHHHDRNLHGTDEHILSHISI